MATRKPPTTVLVGTPTRPTHSTFLLVSLIGSLPAALASGPEGSAFKGREQSQPIPVAIRFHGAIVAPGSWRSARLPNSRMERNALIARGADGAPLDVHFDTYWDEFLEGHPLKLQVGSERIWQLKVTGMQFMRGLSKAPFAPLDSVPDLRVRQALGDSNATGDDVVYANIG